MDSKQINVALVAVKTSLAAVKTAVSDAVTAEAKVLMDPKGDADAKLAASTSLNTLGKINKAVTRSEGRNLKTITRIEGFLKGSEPKAPRAKKEKPEAAKK